MTNGPATDADQKARPLLETEPWMYTLLSGLPCEVLPVTEFDLQWLQRVIANHCAKLFCKEVGCWCFRNSFAKVPHAESAETDALLEEDEEWVDIDAADADNELACTAYVESIMEHLYASEVRSPCAGPPPLCNR